MAVGGGTEEMQFRSQQQQNNNIKMTRSNIFHNAAIYSNDDAYSHYSRIDLTNNGPLIVLFSSPFVADDVTPPKNSVVIDVRPTPVSRNSL